MARKSYMKQARASVDRMKAEREGKAEPGDSPAEDAAENESGNPFVKKKKPTPK